MDVFEIIFLLFLCSSTSTSKKNVDSFHDELFGSGDFYEGYKVSWIQIIQQIQTHKNAFFVARL